ncbi:DUF6491 family protein [Marinimicrobium sp. C2-29]|uniref:DUF6491 family protein n=1 Tax=Marinimicrobium sp. C2-29 TaxID=3139825 RepID=UPI003139697A
MMIKSLLSGVGLAVLVSGCAQWGNDSVPRFHQILKDTTGQDGRACIRHSDIRGYGVLDEEVISIDARREYYLATVLPGCHALETSPRAIFEERFSEVCGGGRDRVHVEDGHCTIRQIFEFENREAAFEAHRKAIEKRDELRAEAEE